MSTIGHAIVLTYEKNGFARESALMALGWVKLTGGDYTQPATPERMREFRDLMNDVAFDFQRIVKETAVYGEQEQESIPLAVKENNVEALVLELVAAMGLHPAVAMQMLGVISYAGGDLKKHIHIPTLSAHMAKAGARHGYQVEMQKAEDVPINITGAVA